jgi:hypothetical protein
VKNLGTLVRQISELSGDQSPNRFCALTIMLSRKPTAIKLTQEDVQDYDSFAAQKETLAQAQGTSGHSRKPSKGKEVAPSAQERQQAMDERIGLAAGPAGARTARR